MSNRETGRRGEECAVDFLKKNRYRIVARNYRSRWGEIDIIAWDSATICFVEVKSRSSDSFGLPQEALSRTKQRRIIKLALGFLKDKQLLESAARFDVVSVFLGQGQPRIELIKNAFEIDSSVVV